MKENVVLSLKNGNFVLIAKNFLIVNILQSEIVAFASQSSAINFTQLNLKEGILIEWEDIVEITSLLQEKIIAIERKTADKSRIITFEMKNRADRDQCIEFLYQKLKKDFTNSVQQQRLAAVSYSPFVWSAAVIAVVAALAGYAYAFQQPLEKLHALKQAMNIFLISNIIESAIPTIFSGVFVMGCLFILLYQLTSRPLAIMIEKNQRNN